MHKKDRLRELAQQYSLDLFILFGSRAKARYREGSDYDFAFYTKKIISPQAELDLCNDLIEIFETEKIDLININTHTDVSLRKEIFFEGELIYESSDGLYLDLALRAWMDYIDFQPYLDESYKNIGRISEKMIANG